MSLTDIPTDDEITDYLGNLRTDNTSRHPYPRATTPRVPWRSGPALDPLTESEYRREQADYDGSGW
ncbi:hypothetical protein ACQP1V_43120 (plasmid) [Microtetraspora malaysiensis]|uniref:hypothetical protein n=1 Tax=Microtetraspora malaysiensis TaxID=161358 RepID=UPI003D91EE53